MKSEVTLIFFYLLFYGVSTQSILALHQHCFGILCTSTDLELVSVNPDGKFTSKALIIAKTSTKFFNDRAFVSTYDNVGQKFYVIIHPNPTDYHTVYPMALYVVDVAAGKLSHTVNLTVSNIDVSTIEFDVRQNKLYGVFFENLYEINTSTGALTKVAQIHVPKNTFLNGNVSCYDSDTSRFILTVYDLPSDNPDVFYYYSVNTVTGNVTRSPATELSFHEVAAMWVDPNLKNYLIEITDSILGAAVYQAQLITSDAKRIYPLGGTGLLSYGSDGRFTSSTFDYSKHNLHFAFDEDSGSESSYNLWILNVDGKGKQISNNRLQESSTNYHFYSSD